MSRMRGLGLDGMFLRTIVGRRILGLFFLCALIPTTLLAIVSYSQVTDQMDAHADASLRQGAKSAGLGLLRRLDMAETRLSLVAMQAAGATEPSPDDVFRQIAIVAGDSVRVFGENPRAAFPVPDLSAAAIAHLDRGRVVFVIDSVDTYADRTLLGIRLAGAGDRTVWGVLDTGFLWGETTIDDVPTGMAACIFADGMEALHCPIAGERRLIESLAGRPPASNGPRLDWTDRLGTDHVAASWSVFLKARYEHSALFVVATQPRADVMAAQTMFRSAFLKIVMIALVVVLLLSNVQIRRSLRPLQALRNGTQKLTEGDLGVQIEVQSTDEFGELAESFNTMSQRMGRQFRELEALHDVDLAVISSLDRATIIDTVVAHANFAVSAESVTLTLLDSPGARTGRTWVGENGQRSSFTARFSESEIHAISGAPAGLAIRDPAMVQRIALAGSAALITGWTILPIFHRGSLIAMLGVGHSAPVLSSEDTARATRLAHKVAVALANTALLEELDSLSWGTMTAFARAIDAKSRWTAGHSERVTSVSVDIARQMGLSTREIDMIRRGAILHDIGKIGVRAGILDKPGKLTDEEMAAMREHPRIGARILEPIPQFSDILPIVLYHHERMDGSGYPEGLAGDALPRLARIVAVADVYDALGSDRPYRAGMDHEKVYRLIREDSGIGFDPEVVDALFAMLANQLVRPSRINQEVEVAV